MAHHNAARGGSRCQLLFYISHGRPSIDSGRASQASSPDRITAEGAGTNSLTPARSQLQEPETLSDVFSHFLAHARRGVVLAFCQPAPPCGTRCRVLRCRVEGAFGKAGPEAPTEPSWTLAVRECAPSKLVSRLNYLFDKEHR